MQFKLEIIRDKISFSEKTETIFLKAGYGKYLNSKNKVEIFWYLLPINYSLGPPCPLGAPKNRGDVDLWRR